MRSFLTADAVRLVKEIIAVAKRCFGILIDSNDDRLDVLIAVALARRAKPNFGERLAITDSPAG
jgi:hypothetical protein